MRPDEKFEQEPESKIAGYAASKEADHGWEEPGIELWGFVESDDWNLESLV
jgi:hypothetical protein